MAGWLIADRYEMLALLGRGAEGQVWRAWDRRGRRVAALKLRPYRGAADDTALAEARVLGSIGRHPGLPAVRDVFVEGARWVLDMDWISGENLADFLALRGRPGLPIAEAVPLLAQVAAALEHLHSLEPPIVHGDVKPANIIVQPNGRAVLVDFGIAAVSAAERNRVYRSEGYAAPEIARFAAPRPSADIYALAACAFTMLTGGLPGAVTLPAADPAAAALSAARAGLSSTPDRRPAAGELVRSVAAAAGVPEAAISSGPSTEPFGDLTPLDRWAFDHSPEPLIDRNEELDRLHRLWSESLSGERRLILLAGEPGSGKTALAAELARRAHAEGAHVLVGLCRRDGSTRAIDEVLYHLTTFGSGEWFSEGALSALRPSEGGTGTETDRAVVGDGEPGTIGTALSEIISRASLDRPTLLIVEDAQWADRATMQTLVSIAVSDRPARVAAVVTLREGDVDEVAENRRVLLELRRDRDHVHQLRLGGLDAPAVAAMIIARLNRGATMPFAERFTEITGGNPMVVGRFLAEFARTQPHGAHATLTESDLEGLASPDDVRHVRRLDRVSDHARTLLATAAMVGEEIDTRVLRRVVDVPEDAFDPTIQELLDEGLLIEQPPRPGALRFADDLVRVASQSLIAPTERSALHWRIFRTLSELRPDELDNTARHAGLGAPAGEPAVAFEVLRRAATEAAARGRPERAEAHLAAALRLAEGVLDAPPTLVLELLMARGEQLMYINRVDEAQAVGRRAVELAEQLGEPTMLASAVWLSMSVVSGQDDLHTVLDLVDRAYRAQPLTALRTRIQLLTTQAQVRLELTLGRDGIAALEEAERLAHAANDEWVDVWMIGARAPARIASRDLDERARFCREAIPRALAVGNDLLGGVLLQCELMAALVASGDRDAVEAEVASIEARAQRMVSQRRLLSTVRACLLLADGDLASARAEIERGYAETGFQPVDRYEHDLQLMRLLELSGGGPGAGTEQTPWAIPSIQRSVELTAAVAAARRGDAGAARDALASNLPHARPWARLSWRWLDAVTRLAELAYWANATDEAAELVGHLGPWSGTLLIFDRMIWIDGAVDRFLGMLSLVLGDRDRAIEQFQAAIALEERFRAPGLVAESTRWLERALEVPSR